MRKLAQRGEFLLTREIREGDPDSVLAWLTLTDDPGNLRQLEHELSLADELDRAGAIRPLELAQDGRATLFLQDPGGEPLASLIGSDPALETFLELAIEITAALGRVHARGLIHGLWFGDAPAPGVTGCRVAGLRRNPGLHGSGAHRENEPLGGLPQ
jgi:hypothetical protein